MSNIVWAWCRRSATIAWARVCIALGVVLEAFERLSEFVTAILPQIAPYVPPRWMGATALIVAVGTELARRRTLDRWPHA